jgi:LemA protein
MALAGLIILVVLILLTLWFVGAYNGLVRMGQEVKSAWAQIDVQLKRRHDLIPNLVESVKGYMAHERQTLENVTKARTQAISAEGLKDKAQAENFLTQTLRSLFAVAERYPDLKANQNVMQLQEELTSTENRISFARQFYNDQAMRMNTLVKSIPTNIVAQVAGFKEAEFFELEDTAQREAPQVKLS